MVPGWRKWIFWGWEQALRLTAWPYFLASLFSYPHRCEQAAFYSHHSHVPVLLPVLAWPDGCHQTMGPVKSFLFSVFLLQCLTTAMRQLANTDTVYIPFKASTFVKHRSSTTIMKSSTDFLCYKNDLGSYNCLSEAL